MIWLFYLMEFQGALSSVLGREQVTITGFVRYGTGTLAGSQMLQLKLINPRASIQLQRWFRVRSTMGGIATLAAFIAKSTG
jgi:hypothetical protein